MIRRDKTTNVNLVCWSRKPDNKCSGCYSKGFPIANHKMWVRVKGQLLKKSTVYLLAHVGGLLVMLSTLSSDVALRSELPWSRPSTFPCCAFPQCFLFHSPVFSRLNCCSTCLQPLPLTEPAHPSLPHRVPPPSITSFMTSRSSKQAREGEATLDRIRSILTKSLIRELLHYQDLIWSKV